MSPLKLITPLILTGALLVSCGLAGQGQTSAAAQAGNSQDGPVPRQLQILTTVTMLADMVEELSDGQHIVHAMARSEADLASTPPSAAMMDQAVYDALFYVGAGYEPFIREFIEQIDKNQVNVVNVSRGVEILRHVVNKLDSENPYYLMNSTNYKIALSSIKNSLQEMDPARKTLYDERFVERSRDIDDFQKQVRTFMEAQDQVIFLVDSDQAAYVVREYQKNYQTIAEFIQRNNNAAASTQATASLSGSIPEAEYRLFVYTEDVSLQKYGDDIIKYSLIPIRVHLYDESLTLPEGFQKQFELIQNALTP